MIRLPLQVKEPEEEAPGEVVLVMEKLDESPVTAQQIKAQTGKDPCLLVVRSWVMTAWPKSLSNTVYADREDFKTSGHRQNELTVYDGCVMWGHRVVISPRTRAKVLDTLHEGHPGICKAKALARG